MVPLLLIYLLKRQPGFKRYLERIKLFFLFVFMLLLSKTNYADNIKLNYLIKRNGKVVGYLNYKRIEANNLVAYKLESRVSDKFIFSVVVNTREETIYENGILKSSSIFRMQNGKVKTDKKIVAYSDKYYTTENNETLSSSYYVVDFGVLHLFVHEPFGRKVIYVENQHKIIPIIKQNEHQYKVVFPNGAYNQYYYTNGFCTKIEVHHSLFSVTMELIQ